MESNNQSGLPQDTERAINERIDFMERITANQKPKNLMDSYRDGMRRGLKEGARIALQNQSGAGEGEKVHKDVRTKAQQAAREKADELYLCGNTPTKSNFRYGYKLGFEAGHLSAQPEISQQPVSESGEGLVERMREAIEKCWDESFDTVDDEKAFIPASARACAAIAQSIPAPVAPVQLSEEEAGKLFDDNADFRSSAGYTKSGHKVSGVEKMMTREAFIIAIQSLQFPQQEREAVDYDTQLKFWQIEVPRIINLYPDVCLQDGQLSVSDYIASLLEKKQQEIYTTQKQQPND